MNGRQGKFWRLILCSSTILLFILFIQTNGIQNAVATKMKEGQLPDTIELDILNNDSSISEPVKVLSEKGNHDVGQTEKTITHEEIIRLTDEFIDLLVQETNENYQVTRYDTKENLLDSFEKVAKRNIAVEYVDFYYYEDEGKLYIVPTETPPWFNKNNDYDVVQLDHDKVEVIQKNNSDLYGQYTVEYEFTYQDDEWIISNITHS